MSKQLSPATSAHTLVSPNDTVAAKDKAIDNDTGIDKSKPQTTPPPAGGHPVLHAPLEVSRTRFWLIFISLMVSVFLFALDQLIVTTAIPKITVAFNSLTELSWLASGFFLTLLGFNLIYSQLLQILPSKHVIIFAVAIFEIGSLVCGVAPNMNVLILGRAIAGVGAAGIFSTSMVIIAELTTLHDRAKYFGLFGVCFAVASVVGPLVGGAFSDKISWRWCFYINLPIGGLALALIILFQPTAPPLGRKDTYTGYSRKTAMQILQLDWFGVAISMAWGCCAILSMQWGGVTKSWKDPSVIATLVLTAVLPPVFIGWEWWLGEKAMFKLRLIKRISIAGASIVSFCLFATFMLEVYYLSEAYQAVYHTSATGAGIRLLPLIMVQIFTLIASSRIIPKTGRIKWALVTGPCFLCLASGLLYSVKFGTTEAHLYGYQVIMGIGIGMALQNTMLIVQYDLKGEPRLISAGTGLIVFIGFAGRIIGISLAGSVFQNMIKVNLHKYASDLPIQYMEAIVNSASAVWTTVPQQYHNEVLTAYTETLRCVYIIGVPLSIIGLGGGLIIKNLKLQSKEDEMAGIQAQKDRAAGLAEKPKGVVDAETAREAEIAETIGDVNPLPPQAVEGGVGGGVDERVLSDRNEGKSVV